MNDMNQVFFSVVIPTRNRPIEFKKALDSVLMQSFKKFEVIVVNDGTNKLYRDAYNKLEEIKPAHVQYINLIERSRGHGHCFARNQGVTVAQGKFICFLDDDDWWTDIDFLLRAQQEINDQNADFYFANQKAITHDGIQIPNVWVENLPATLPHNDPRLAKTVFPVSVSELLKATGFPHQNCWAISKELYVKIDGMDENLRYEPDRDIYLRALDKAEHILYDQTVVALHNIPDSSKKNNASTATNKLQKLLFQLRTAEKGILFSEKAELVKFCQKIKIYILKKITAELVQNEKIKLASTYAFQALVISPSIKWSIYAFYLKIKSINN